MGSLRILFSNYLINVGFVAWFSAQLIKTLLVLISTKKFEAERLFGAGGMPSSHSALACSMAIGMCRKMGFDSPEFALALAFAAVVMYDAMGVRRETGKQGRVLNEMLEIFTNMGNQISAEEKLKEFVGHTPLQVLMGAILGALIALMVGNI